MQDVAEHPGHARRLRAPRQHLEGGRVGLGQHVRLVDAGEALDRRAVEADALGEGALELGGRDRHRLQEPEDVGEPQSDEADVTFLERAEHELLLLVHARHPVRAVLPPCYRNDHLAGPSLEDAPTVHRPVSGENLGRSPCAAAGPSAIVCASGAPLPSPGGSGAPPVSGSIGPDGARPGGGTVVPCAGSAWCWPSAGGPGSRVQFRWGHRVAVRDRVRPLGERVPVGVGVAVRLG